VGVGQAAGSAAVNTIAGSGVMYMFLKKNGMGCKITILNNEVEQGGNRMCT